MWATRFYLHVVLHTRRKNRACCCCAAAALSTETTINTCSFVVGIKCLRAHTHTHAHSRTKFLISARVCVYISTYFSFSRFLFLFVLLNYLSSAHRSALFEFTKFCIALQIIIKHFQFSQLLQIYIINKRVSALASALLISCSRNVRSVVFTPSIE